LLLDLFRDTSVQGDWTTFCDPSIFFGVAPLSTAPVKHRFPICSEKSGLSVRTDLHAMDQDHENTPRLNA